MSVIYKKCPKCGSRNVLKIIYGMPPYEMYLKEKRGEIKLGGCRISDFSPEYYCKDCEHEWNKKESIDKAYSEIKGIRSSVGGFFSGYYEVHLDFKTRKLKWSHIGSGNEDYFEKRVRQSSIDRFIEDLKSVKFLNWKSKYIEPGVCDGTQWEIEIIKEDRNVKKYGDNKFPKDWDEFCEIIKRISGKKFG